MTMAAQVPLSRLIDEGLASYAHLWRTLNDHPDRVVCLAITPDGSRMISGGDDHRLRVWDLPSGQLERTLEGHTDRVYAVAITRDGRQIVSGGADHKLLVWDFASGQIQRTLEGHKTSVHSVAITPNGSDIVSSGNDGTIRIWDLKTGHAGRVLERQAEAAQAVAITPDSRRVVSGSRDPTVRVWDLASGQLELTLDGHTDWVYAVAVTPDGSRIVSGGDETIRVWDLRSGRMERVLSGHTDRVRKVAITPDGSKIVSGAEDHTVRVWDLESGQLERTLEGHTLSVYGVAITPDGRKIVSCGEDRTVRVWDLESGQLERTVGNESVLGRWLATRSPEDQSEIRGLITNLPQPHPALPIRILASLGQDVFAGKLELLRGITSNDAESSSSGSVAAPFADWFGAYQADLLWLVPELKRRRGPNASTWALWTPPPDDPPFEAGRISWPDVVRLAEPLGGSIGLGPVAGMYVVVRDWERDLRDLLVRAGANEDGLMRALRAELDSRPSRNVAVPEATRTTKWHEPFVAAEEKVRAELGLELSSWTIVLAFVRASGVHGSAVAEYVNDERLVAAIRERAAALPGPDASPLPSASIGPTPSIASDFWTTEDRLGYDLFADALTALIVHRDTKPPLTIGIRAPWGAGKTSLMRMVRERLERTGDEGPEQPDGERQHMTRMAGDSDSAVEVFDLHRTTVSGDQGEKSVRPTVGQALDSLVPADDRPVSGKRAPEATAVGNKVRGVPAKSMLEGWRPTVWFNPWMYQTADQTWAGLGSAIIKQVTERMKRADREAFWLALNLRRIDADAIRRAIYVNIALRVLPLVAIVVVSAAFSLVVVALFGPAWIVTGVAPAGLGFLATKKLRDILSGPVAGTYDEIVRQPDYTSKVGALQLLERDMKDVLDLVATPERPLVVFIDDLDRCSSKVVTEVVEAINLFLASEFENCIFVIAMEPDLVAAHLEIAYKDLAGQLALRQNAASGGKLGWLFLDKVVQLPLSLPHPEPSRVAGYLDSTLAAAKPDSDLDLEKRRQFRQLTLELRKKVVDRVRQSTGLASVRKTSEAVVEESTAAGALPREALVRETANLASDDLFSNDDQAVRELVRRWAGHLWRNNPREMKRFLNLYRFYAFLKVRRLNMGLPTPTDDELAKLAVLGIRWPHLAGLLGQPIGPSDPRQQIALLEDLARSAPKGGRKGAVHEAPPLDKRLLDELTSSEELREYLVSEPRLADRLAGFA